MRFSESTIGIAGLGLMGGSLALALRGKCGALLGVARTAETAEQAVAAGVVDFAAGDVREVAGQADILVLATPVRHIISTVPQVAALMRPGSLLIDLGSTKAQVVAAMNAIQEDIAAVGGHPMCGKERGGLAAADPAIYRGARFVLSPTRRSTPEAISLAEELARAVGSIPMLLDAERHDRAVATISHLAYLVSASLMATGMEADACDPVVGELAASGFRDTTRVAGSPVDMMLDIMLTNRPCVEQALDLFERNLAEMRAVLGDEAAMRDRMTSVQTARREMFL